LGDVDLEAVEGKEKTGDALIELPPALLLEAPEHARTLQMLGHEKAGGQLSLDV
jgi:hypothetical protein